MSYTKREWANGNVVGAVDLNRIENGIADIDVDEIRGWSVQSTQLFSETVTTEFIDFNRAVLTYDQFVGNDTVVVTIDGTDYEVSNTSTDPSATAYGAQWSDSLENYDFSTYPFNYFSDQTGYNCITMQTAGTYSVSVVADGIVTSNGFADAVNAVVEVPSSGPWYYSAYNNSSVTIPANETLNIESWGLSTDGYIDEDSDVRLIVTGVVVSNVAIANMPTIVMWSFSGNEEGVGGALTLRNNTSSPLTLNSGDVNVWLVSFSEIIPWNNHIT